ncbi:antibiotic biosynthesis monooxygenase family protein [Streptomyces virginiae]|uniref:antibiotic biosynthesis monooxygenase family protein n=1 Tax=Streptomyces virginiae TaxID=1961 RepID=UPI003416409B
MITIDKDADTLTVMIVFTLEASDQPALLEAIRTFVQDVVRHQPGFVSSTVHVSDDGTRIINYAQWENRDALEAFRANPEAMNRRGDIMRFDQESHTYRIAFQSERLAP